MELTKMTSTKNMVLAGLGMEQQEVQIVSGRNICDISDMMTCGPADSSAIILKQLDGSVISYC